MTQEERDRLVALKKAKNGLITQKQAAEEIGVTERQVRRMLRVLRQRGDAIVIHAGRGRRSNRRIADGVQEAAIAILKRPVCRDFRPSFAAEYLHREHGIQVGRETLRGWMQRAKLWTAEAKKIRKIHQWRERRSRRGEMVQWDTSEHDWLESRGPKLYLIAMVDDATSELTARFALHDSSEENMRLLKSYVERNGRPVSFYTDKASLFQTAPKVQRDQTQLPRDERAPLPPTQIGRALSELQIVWKAAHSPQAKGRIERSFQTAQDRLVKGLRLAGAETLEQANAYLEAKYLPWWNRTLRRVPASAEDAHRALGPEHNPDSSLSLVEMRQVADDYTIHFKSKLYRIDRADVRTGMRRGIVRVEKRLDGTLAFRFQRHWLKVELCEPRPKISRPTAPITTVPGKRKPFVPSEAMRRSMHNFLGGSKDFAKNAGQTTPGDLSR